MQIELHHLDDTTTMLGVKDILSELTVCHLLSPDISKYDLLTHPKAIFKIKATPVRANWNDPDVREDLFRFAAAVLLPSGVLEAPGDNVDTFLDKERLSDTMYLYKRPCKFAISKEKFKKLWILPEFQSESIVRPYLYTHQTDGFNFWKTKGYRGLWAHDMGLGKTFTAGFVLYVNMFKKKWKRPLVITLDSIILKWESILTSYGIPYVLFKKGLDTASVPEGTVILGNIEKVKKYRAPEDDGTKEGAAAVKRFARLHLLEKIRILFHKGLNDLIIFDESHKLNSASNLIVKVLRRIITEKTSVLFMSGTPFGNGFHEVFPQMNLIQPGIFGETTQSAFYNRYCENKSRNSAYEKWEVQEYYFPLLKKKIHSRAQFVKNAPGLVLPPFTENTMPYRLTKEQNRILRSFSKKYLFPLPEDPPEWLRTICPGGIPLSSAPLIRHLKRMLCSGICTARVFIPGMPEEYYDKGYPLELRTPTRKYKALIDTLDSRADGDQSLIWVNYVATGKDLVKKLKAEGRSIELIYGGTPKKQKIKLVEKFLKGEIRDLCSHPLCLGTGLDFINATLQIAYECPESSINYDQAKKRSHRIGQTRAVQMIRLYGQNSIEKRIVDMLDGKLAFSDYVFEVEKVKKPIPKEHEAFKWKVTEDGTLDSEEETISDLDDDSTL